MEMTPNSNGSLPMINTHMGYHYQPEETLKKYPQLSYQIQNQPLPSLQHQLMRPPFTPLYHYPGQQEQFDPMAFHSNAMNNNNNIKYNTSNLPLFQPFNKPSMDFLTVQQGQQHQQLRQVSPLSPLNTNLYGRPIFELPSQSSITMNIEKNGISDSAVSKAIEAAEAFVAKEVGHVPRRRKSGTTNHKPDSSYLCHTCGKSFNRPYNLKSHQKTHSSEKPFPCKFCSKSFARSHDRKRHEKLHLGEKRFKCGGVLKDGITRWGCNRRFARADALGRHFRTETGWSCIKPLMTEAKLQEAKGTLQIQNLEIDKLLQNKTEVGSDSL